MSARNRMRNTVLLAALATMSFATQSPASAAPAVKIRPVRIGVAYDGPVIEDKSFNELTAKGVDRAANKYNLKVFEELSVDKRGRPVERLTVLTKLVQRSPSLVLAVGFLYQEAVATAAAAYPLTNFAIIDAIPEPRANSKGLLFAANEGSFLVGAAAALKSTSLRIGFIGGADFPVIQEWRAGFVAGVTHIAPTATVEVEYVGTDGGGFNDPDKAYQMALDMYARGIDIILPAAGGSTIGVARAARDYSAAHDKVWMIGVDSDMYKQVGRSLKPFVLTSMIKRVDIAVRDTIEAQATGRFVGGVERFDLARKGVDYTTSGGFIDDIVPTLEALRAAIIAGDIVVP